MTSGTSEDPKRSHEKAGLLKAIVCGGLFAGLLDLTFALIYTSAKGGKPMKVLQAIAAGVQGKTAYQGGVETAALGVALHFTIAIGAAAVFCIVACWQPIVLRRWWISGPVFGLGVYYFMNLVVLPWSALKMKGDPLKWEPWMLAAHVLFVGLPIVLVARRYLAAKSK